MEVILASQSPSRKMLLNSLKIPFKIIPHTVDEDFYKNQIQDPYLLCQTLAQKKASSVQKKGNWVIGVDQMASLRGQVFGKPQTKEKAIDTLRQLSGKTHELISGMFIQKPDGSFFKDLIINKMSMKSLTQKQIERYLEIDQPFKCAGSYRIEGRGISLFEKIESPDFNSIMGLPLISLCQHLPIEEW